VRAKRAQLLAGFFTIAFFFLLQLPPPQSHPSSVNARAQRPGRADRLMRAGATAGAAAGVISEMSREGKERGTPEAKRCSSRDDAL
jgi:hypothetical protein